MKAPCIASLSLFLILSQPCLAATATWNGSNGSWSGAHGWSTPNVPGSADDVVLPTAIGVGFTVTLDQDGSIRNYTQNGGILTADSQSRTLTLSGPFAWTNGQIAGATTIIANGGGSVSGSGNKQFGHSSQTQAPTLLNYGTFTLNGSLYVAARTSGTPRAKITNHHIFNFPGSAGIAGSISGNYPGVFENKGTINKTGNQTHTTLGLIFDNWGLVNVSAGTLGIPEGTDHPHSHYKTTGNGVLRFNSSNRILGPGVTIEGNGTVVFAGATLNGAAYDVANTVIAGTLNINHPVIFKNLEMTTNARRTGSEDLIISGPFNWNTGTIGGSGETFANGPINISSGGTRNVGEVSGNSTTRLISNDTADLRQGSVRINRGSEFVNRGTFNHHPSTTVDVGGFGNELGKFINRGEYVKLASGTGRVNAVFDNEDTVTVDRGVLNLTGGGYDFAGEYIVGSNGTLEFGGGTRILDTWSSVEGAGDVTFSNGTTTLDNSSYNITGRTTITNNGVANFDTFSKATTRFLTVSGSGTRAGRSLLEASDTFTWTGGTLASGTETNVNGIQLSGNSTKYLGSGGSAKGAILRNYGSGTMSGDSNLTIRGTSSSSAQGSRFFNYGNITASGNMGILSQPSSGDSGLFVNGVGGGFIKNGIDTTTEIEVLFQNSGSVFATEGTLSFSGGFEQSAGQLVLADGTVSGNLNINGGSLTGSGTIIGDTANDRLLAPGTSVGFINFDGNLVLKSGSQLLLEIGGNDRGTEHDAFDVSETLTLGGILTVDLIDDYKPMAGDTFELWNASVTTGSFTTVDLPELSGGLSWDTSELISAGRLRVSGGTSFTYDDFAALYSLSEGPDGDDDGDGLSNLIEFILDSHPGDPNSAPVMRIERFGTATTITLDVPETPYENVSMRIETTTDLLREPWSILAERPAGDTWSAPALLSSPENGRQTVTVEINGNDPARFYRFGGSYP